MKKTITIKHTGVGGDVRVEIDCARNMALEAAGILSRRQYGRRGTVAALRLDSWGADGKSHTYQAFIGRSPTVSQAIKYGYSVTGYYVLIYV